MTSPLTRTFDTGAIRDTSGGKLEYYGFRHPLLEHSFASYMHKHRHMNDGTLRDSNNWWKGWDKSVSLHSLVRHVEDLQALHAGYRVYKERFGTSETTHILREGEEADTSWEEVSESDTCNAIRFNAMAYNLQEIDKKK